MLVLLVYITKAFIKLKCRTRHARLLVYPSDFLGRRQEAEHNPGQQRRSEAKQTGGGNHGI
jgi:hypothetical protein